MALNIVIYCLWGLYQDPTNARALRDFQEKARALDYIAYVCVLSSFSCARLFGMLWTVASQAPRSMGFFRQDYCSGLPCPLPGDLPDPEIESVSLKSLALTGRFFFFFLICSEFCHTLKWNGLEFTCLPHPDPPRFFTTSDIWEAPIVHILPATTIRSCKKQISFDPS